MNEEIKKLNDRALKYAKRINELEDEVKKMIVGQEETLKRLMISLIARGHVLVEGVPGLAKTLMIKSIADAVKLDYQRIQFTPDLLPADILGTRIFNMKTNTFSTKQGPIFTNFILADEINRAPPKCQSALLEAMQEKQVTIGEDSFILDNPFFVLATQNPLEHEGVYNLPEAQVDRFMFKILIGYPSKEEEKIIIERMTEGKEIIIKKIMEKKELVEIQDFCHKVYADEKIKDYVTEIVDATRNPESIDVNGMIECGASPRASIWLILASKANAILEGRGYVVPEDVKDVAYEVLRHRISLSFEAEAEKVTPDDIISKILDKVESP